MKCKTESRRLTGTSRRKAESKQERVPDNLKYREVRNESVSPTLPYISIPAMKFSRHKLHRSGDAVSDSGWFAPTA